MILLKICVLEKKNGSNKLTEEAVKEIYLSNIPYNKLAKMFNVSKTTIYHIKHKIYWKWFTDELDERGK